MKNAWVLLAATALLAGCNVPGAAGFLGGAGPTITGSVKNMTGDGVRVGLMGALTAGGRTREIASATVNGGAFALPLPGVPPIDTMEQPDEQRSIVFTLRAYQDRNGNGAWDNGETLCDCSSGQFRYFASDGPEGSYKAGWNTLIGGRYTQSFDTAFAL